MAYSEKLHVASFRNVPFFVTSENEDGGKKIAEHNYPRRNVRFDEELGTAPPKFSIQAIVHGENADQERRRLITAMTTEGLGTLVHPVYGVLQVRSTNYSVSSTDKRVGEFHFILNFSTSESFVSLVADTTSSSEVDAAAETAATASDDALEYEDPTFIDSISAAADQVNAFIDEIEAQVDSVVAPIQEGVSELVSVVERTRRNVFSLVRRGESLKSSLRAVWDAFISVANTPADLRDALLELADFSFISSSFEATTARRIQIFNNQNSINDHVRVNALIALNNSAATTEFKTDEEVRDFRVDLEDVFIRVVEEAGQLSMPSSQGVIAINENRIVSNVQLRANLNDLRNKTRDVLDNSERNAWRVVDVQTNRTSASLIAYELYGSIDRIQEVKDLNPFENFSHINVGTIRAVADGSSNTN